MFKKMIITRYLAVLLAAVMTLGALPALAASEYDGLEVADISSAGGCRVAVSGTAVTLTVPYASTAGVAISSAMSAKAKTAVSVGGEQYTVELTDNGFTSGNLVQIGGYAQVPVSYSLKKAGSAAEAYTGTTTYKVYAGKASSFTSVSKAIELTAVGLRSVSVAAGDFGTDRTDDDPCTEFELVSGTTPPYLSVTANGAAYSVGSGGKCTNLVFAVNESRISSVEYDVDTAYSVKAYDRGGALIGEGTLRVRVTPPAAVPVKINIGAEETAVLHAAQYTSDVCGAIVPATVKFDNVPTGTQGTLTLSGQEVRPGVTYPIGQLSFKAAKSGRGDVEIAYTCYDTAGYSFKNSITFSVDNSDAEEIVKKTTISLGALTTALPVEIKYEEIKAACTSGSSDLAYVRFSAIPASDLDVKVGGYSLGTGGIWDDFSRDIVITPLKSGTFTFRYEAMGRDRAYSGTIKIIVSNGKLEDTNFYVTYNKDKTKNLVSLEKAAQTVISAAKEAMNVQSVGNIILTLLPYSVQGTLSSNYGTFYTSASSNVPATSDTVYTEESFKGLYYAPTEEIGSVELGYTIYDPTNVLYVTGTIHVVSQSSSAVSYTTTRNNSVFFAKEDFDEALKSALGSGYTLVSVRFSEGTLQNGSLYYTAAGTSDTLISPEKEYSRQMLDGVYFKPESNYIGSANSVGFTASAYYGKNSGTVVSFSGTVSITVRDQIDVIYQTSVGKPLAFDEEDFSAVLAEYKKSAEFQGIILDTLPETGILYEKYGEKEEERVPARTGTLYLASKVRKAAESDVYISSLTYVPGSGSENSTVSLSLVVYGSDTAAVQRNAVMQIRITKGEVAAISGSAYCTGALFSGTSFGKISTTATGEGLSYVEFCAPDPNAGSLFYNYKSATEYEYRLTPSVKCYVTAPSGNEALISKVAFVPVAGYSGTQTIKYTAYDVKGNWYIGTISVKIITKDKSSVFTDVAGSYKWSADSVDFLYTNNVTKGVTATSYGPESNIKRGDFMLMLYRAFGLSKYDSYASSVSNFSDVKQDYYATAIRVARYLEIAKGDGTNFSPESSITREEAMALIYRTINKVGWKLSHRSGTDYNAFSDRNDVSSYASECMNYFVQTGVVVGSGGKLNPKQPITRAEMAVTLHRVLTY